MHPTLLHQELQRRQVHRPNWWLMLGLLAVFAGEGYCPAGPPVAERGWGQEVTSLLPWVRRVEGRPARGMVAPVAISVQVSNLYWRMLEQADVALTQATFAQRQPVVFSPQHLPYLQRLLRPPTS
ncbi:MAG TPA: hypothetical protein EYP85_17170 [Armatimonadetes bacterium]|nr:hypothetical protein [Armatimonadota bacterium]